MKKITLLLMLAILGCDVSPFSPNLRQQLDNTNGQIDEIKNNQNGIQLEIGKIRQQQDINAKEIENAQQGIINLRGSNYSGVQIFSGDGGLILFFSLIVFSGTLIYHYRTRAIKSEKTAELFAQSITAQNNLDLENHVFMSALNTDMESDVYHLLVKSQTLMGRRQG